MRAITHEVAPGVTATCRMEGDTFEMEDQRAWSDASYKTYVRPLALPWPYRLESGAIDRQAVTLTFGGAAPETAAETGPAEITVGPATGEAMPRFGVLIAPEEAESALERIDHLRLLAPRFLLFHFDPLAGHGIEALTVFARIAEALPDAESGLEFVVPARGDLDRECEEAARQVREAGLRLDTLTVGPDIDRQSTPPGSEWPACPPLADIYAAACRAFPGVRLGGGMVSYFTELNRKRVPLDGLDFVTHATCPIVHAADDESVMQTLEALPFITRSTRAFIGDTPYRLGPTTIGMRQNPYGSRTMPNPENRRVPMAADDPRARGLFGAAWLTGYAARLEGAGIEAWCGAAFAGPRGVVAKGGKVTPAFHVARGLAEASGAPRLALASSARSRVDGFAYRDEDGHDILWIANLTADTQALRLAGRWTLSVLDEDSFEDAATGEWPTALPAATLIHLAPFATAQLLSLAPSGETQVA